MLDAAQVLRAFGKFGPPSVSGCWEFRNLILGFCVVLMKLSCRMSVGLPTTHQDSASVYSELVPDIRVCDLAKAVLLEWAVLDPCKTSNFQQQLSSW